MSNVVKRMSPRGARFRRLGYPGSLTLLLVLMSCGMGSQADVERGETLSVAEAAEARCAFPAAPVIVRDEGGLVLKVWSFPLQDVHSRHVLPDEPTLITLRDALHASGADIPYPTLDVPLAQSPAEADIWRDELFNNDLAYGGEVGSIEPITCLDALLFAEQNARVPQLERPTEFIASVLRRESLGIEEVVVVFGAGTETFPPRSVYGFEIVDEHLAQGWTYWYLLHNHTIQANGALGVPVPSTSDVQFARGLAKTRGLERVRVTNGFYSFDAAVGEIARLRAR